MITIVTDSDGYEQYVVTEADGTRYSLCDRPEVDHPGKPCRHYVDEYVVTLAKTPVRTDELGPMNDSVGIARIIVAQDLVDNGASWQAAQRLAVALSNNRSLQDLQNFFAAVGEPRVTLAKPGVMVSDNASREYGVAEVTALLAADGDYGTCTDYVMVPLRRNDLRMLAEFFWVDHMFSYESEHAAEISAEQSDNITRAGQNLGAFMLAVQAATFDATGVMPVPCSDAPNNYGELLQAAARWQYALGDVFLPVWDGASDDSIYGSAAANHAFRYWHDMGHIAHHCDFTPDGEFNLQFDHHLPIVADHFGKDSLEYRMYFADTVGQIEYVETNGKFPGNQAQFVSTYVRNARLALNTDY